MAISYSLCHIAGFGKRISRVLCGVCGFETLERVGTFTGEELGRLVEISESIQYYKLPKWILNNRNSETVLSDSHISGLRVRTRIMNEIKKLQSLRLFRGIRHFWHLRLRGQHTKSSGRGCFGSNNRIFLRF